MALRERRGDCNLDERGHCGPGGDPFVALYFYGLEWGLAKARLRGTARRRRWRSLLDACCFRIRGSQAEPACVPRHDPVAPEQRHGPAGSEKGAERDRILAARPA